MSDSLAVGALDKRIADWSSKWLKNGLSLKKHDGIWRKSRRGRLYDLLIMVLLINVQTGSIQFRSRIGHKRVHYAVFAFPVPGPMTTFIED